MMKDNYVTGELLYRLNKVAKNIREYQEYLWVKKHLSDDGNWWVEGGEEYSFERTGEEFFPNPKQEDFEIRWLGKPYEGPSNIVLFEMKYLKEELYRLKEFAIYKEIEIGTPVLGQHYFQVWNHYAKYIEIDGFGFHFDLSRCKHEGLELLGDIVEEIKPNMEADISNEELKYLISYAATAKISRDSFNRIPIEKRFQQIYKVFSGGLYEGYTRGLYK